MRAAVLVGHGGPDQIVVRDDVAVPSPGPGEALIRVEACGLNNTDINTRVGWYSKSVTGATSSGGAGATDNNDTTWGGNGLQFPRIQGADPSGTVAAVGPGVDEHLIGLRVLVDPWIRDETEPGRRELAGYLGSECDGGFAQFCTVPARNVHPHSAPFSAVELASFPCSWSTAEHMLQRVGLRSGQSIAVTGASGGVGTALVALARLRGAQVVAVASKAKLDALRELGADAAVDRNDDDLAAAVVDANGGPLDVVADVVGGVAMPEWLDALRRGGRYVTAGAIAGPMVQLDLRTLYLNDLELYGATVFEPQVFADLVGYIDRGEISPSVGATYELGDIHAAQAAFEHKEHVGAIVLTI